MTTPTAGLPRTGRRVGLINDAAWADHLAKQERMRAMRDLLESTRVSGEMLNALRKKISSFEFPVSSESTQQYVAEVPLHGCSPQIPRSPRALLLGQMIGPGTFNQRRSVHAG